MGLIEEAVIAVLLLGAGWYLYRRHGKNLTNDE